VFLSEKDGTTLAAALQIAYTEFVEIYCRWVPAGSSGGLRKERLSLKEKANNDCIFWDRGCGVYNSRPLQCRAFPFWPSNLSSEERWKAAAAFCPGMDTGTLHGPEYIESLLAQQAAEPTLIQEIRSGSKGLLC
jgi:Fe-S-cluster containining protein